jgi:hypothetical protein
VVDINGNVLSATPVSFTTTAGTLSATLVATDTNGNASTTLTTGLQAVVTATVGAQGATPGTGTGTPGTGTPGTGTGTTNPTGQASGQVTVTVAAAPTVVITPPTTPPSVGLPATFTFAVTVAQGGSAVRDVTVNWGDGDTQSLGAITGTQPVAHVYGAAGTYLIRAAVTDASGNLTTVSTAVSVVPVPRPTIIITPTPQSAPGGSNISFQIRIDVPAGIAVQSAVIDFGDGFSQSLGGASGIVTVTHPYPAGVRTYTVIVTVTDSSGQTTSGTTTVSITT